MLSLVSYQADQRFLEGLATYETRAITDVRVDIENILCVLQLLMLIDIASILYLVLIVEDCLNRSFISGASVTL